MAEPDAVGSGWVSAALTGAAGFDFSWGAALAGAGFPAAFFAAASRSASVTAGSSGIRAGSTLPAGSAPSLAEKATSPSPSNVLAPSFAGATLRSEEHTSELQSLMRLSYAVFCLNKKTTTTCTNNSQDQT